MRKILLVDDTFFFRSFLHRIIKVRGLADEVIEADDGVDGVKKYIAHKPDLVLMDIRMPKVDGIQALKAILKINPRAKVIMVTSVKDETLIEQALNTGALDFLKKPFDNNKVAKLIEKVLYPHKVKVLPKS